MLLNPEDIRSPTWTKIRKHFEGRLQDHRIQNDGRLSDIDTAKLRGRIAEARYVTQLGDPDPVIAE